ncbi:MAG: hypothetical protein LGR52_10235 [Candidatus Thiosymbion ectosymbiont of Robbea hypermnestra]|nr:hypothetical protein [Candidatus Thiosymbion ectosymbiont of Robbea hypermnestra]
MARFQSDGAHKPISPRRILILLAAAFLIWRIGTVGLSSHYARSITAGNNEAVSKALAWDDRQPEALYRRAVALGKEDPDDAADLLIRANRQHPADARPFFVAADTALAQGDLARADALVETALRLKPANPEIHQRVARYWLFRNDAPRAIRHWSLAMEISPALRPSLFPYLLKLAEEPRTWSAYEVLTTSPPSWWDAFFSLVARRAKERATVQRLYSLRRKSEQTPITPAERKSYIARLKQDGLIAQAYITWVNGLTRTQRQRLGLIYNGGFEIESTDWGFDWHMRAGPRVRIERVYTFGSDKGKSLHLAFDGHQGPIDGPFQALFLDAGSYRLSGRVHTDGLATQGGLKWVVRCLRPDAQTLGESERFLGANEWRDFGFEFQVADACTLQEIRLVSAGKNPREYRITGDAWFDRLVIGKQSEPAQDSLRVRNMASP